MGALLRIVDSPTEISQVSSEPVDAQNAKLLNCLRVVYHNSVMFGRNVRQTTLVDASTAMFPSREAKGIPGLHDIRPSRPRNLTRKVERSSSDAYRVLIMRQSIALHYVPSESDYTGSDRILDLIGCHTYSRQSTSSNFFTSRSATLWHPTKS